MLTLRYKLTSSLAVLMANLAMVCAQTPIQIKTEIEIRPAFLVRSYRPTPSGAEEKSSIPLLKEPEYLSKSPRYGKMLVGNAKDKQEVAVVIDQAEGKAPRVYIDLNNNRDLTDDGERSNADSDQDGDRDSTGLSGQVLPPDSIRRSREARHPSRKRA